MNTPSASAPAEVDADKAGPSRRAVIAGASVVAAAVATAPLWQASAAEAAYLPAVRSYRQTRVPAPATRHMANRFAYGYTPALGRQIRAAGGPSAWFNKQLHPVAVADPSPREYASWFPTMGLSAYEQFEHQRQDRGWGWNVQVNEARWTLLRRIHSQRQVHEVMTEFWLNHLHIAADSDLTWLWRHDYDALIRSHALGRFDEMLKAAVVHPAMLVFLDADLSQIERRERYNGDIIVTNKINENLGRELLELHTVGRTAGYDEDQVKSSAHILTGWTVDRFTTWNWHYDPQRHYRGPVRVLGFSDDNSQLDGREVLNRYLDYLAHHPATAQRIARKLAIRFVSDDPSQTLINHLADVFSSSGTDIKATLRALVASQEFQQSIGTKVRTPTDDLVATFRVLGATITRPTHDADAANAVYFLSQTMGAVPFGWPRPDGQPEIGDAWSSAARMLGSYKVHNSVAGHWWPSTGVNYRSHASWLPQSALRFDLLVDHMCRQIHGRGATSRLLGAASLVVNVTPGEIITRDHGLVQWRMPRLIGLLLDTPQHLMK